MSNGTLKDWADFLGVRVNCSRDELRKAYRNMSIRHHPDREEGDVEMMKAVNIAKERLEKVLEWSWVACEVN